jgi:hypothetical protein
VKPRTRYFHYALALFNSSSDDCVLDIEDSKPVLEQLFICVKSYDIVAVMYVGPEPVEDAREPDLNGTFCVITRDRIRVRPMRPAPER